MMRLLGSLPATVRPSAAVFPGDGPKMSSTSLRPYGWFIALLTMAIQWAGDIFWGSSSFIILRGVFLQRWEGSRPYMGQAQ